MKAKLISFIVGGLYIASCSLIAQAQNGYTSSGSQNGSVGANGYSSSVGARVGSAGANGYFSHSGANQGSIGDNGYSSSGSQPHAGYNGHHRDSDTYFVVGHARPFKALFWGNMLAGAPIPNNAVAGGSEQGHPLFLCRGNFHGGVHPGKIVGGTCHISYAGKEIALTHYQILVSGSRLGWVKAGNGFIPKKAIKGGYENNHPLFICQVPYNGGIHPGKVVGQACNIAWGGKEVSIPQYKVLVR